LVACLFKAPVSTTQLLDCARARLAIAVYVASTAMIDLLVNQMLKHGDLILVYRCLNLSVVLALSFLALYSMDAYGLTSETLNPFDFLSLIAIVVGLELYHRRQPTPRVLTNWSP
jgi:drug/metabolite transporter (DMT)-like permease